MAIRHSVCSWTEVDGDHNAIGKKGLLHRTVGGIPVPDVGGADQKVDTRPIFHLLSEGFKQADLFCILMQAALNINTILNVTNFIFFFSRLGG